MPTVIRKLVVRLGPCGYDLACQGGWPRPTKRFRTDKLRLKDLLGVRGTITGAVGPCAFEPKFTKRASRADAPPFFADLSGIALMSIRKFRGCVAHGAAALTLTLTPPMSSVAQAQTVVSFDGDVVPVCIIIVSTPGVLAMSTTGTELGSEQPGGEATILTVSSTGGTPTVRFTAPSMSMKPSAYNGNPTVSLKYTSLGGANQPYTTTSSQYTSTNPLGDTVTLNIKAVDASGYPAGNYRLQANSTCEQ